MRKGRLDEARRTIRRIRSSDISEEEIEQTVALIDYTNKMEVELSASSTYAECFRGKNLWRTEIVRHPMLDIFYDQCWRPTLNVCHAHLEMQACIVQLTQTWGGNGINVQTVQFLEQAGLSESGAFDLNVILNSQYLTFGLFCIWLMTKFGRATIFISGLMISDFFLFTIGILGCVHQSIAVSNAVGSLLLVSSVVYIATVAPTSYTILVSLEILSQGIRMPKRLICSLQSEVPSGKLRAKIVSLSRAAFNLSGLISNVLVPKMLTGGSWNLGAKTAFMFVSAPPPVSPLGTYQIILRLTDFVLSQAGTNALIWIWALFRLPETKGRTFREIDYLFEQSGLHPRKWRTAQIDVFDDDLDRSGKVDVETKGGNVKHLETTL